MALSIFPITLEKVIKLLNLIFALLLVILAIVRWCSDGQGYLRDLLSLYYM